MHRKLRTSPNFSLGATADGACFAAGEVEPYPQYWLDDRERMLFASFGQAGGVEVASAVAALVRAAAPADPEVERTALLAAIAEMEAAGVLIAPDAELSRYDRAMARDYLAHRPFPTALADRIAALGGGGRVLDLAAGPGSLSLELAARGADVTIMELSRGFVAAARDEARARGLAIEAINESCNRLAQHDGVYDAITISQAIHWLDDVALCRGVGRCLGEGGSFFVVHGALSLPDDHPLGYLLGDHTPLGDKRAGPFIDEVQPLLRRIALLLEALDAPHGRAAIVPAGVELYTQARPIDEGFARAFLSDRHIAGLGIERGAFWRDLAARCAGAAPERLLGTLQWALLQFRRGGAAIDTARLAAIAERVIAYP
ncbi:MAG: class I SAM-dependent methyltransferase [Sphingomonadales bacterium]|nr:class I SAM-dependent methyltransferase [Sphingomonadales bacterium]